MNYYIETYQDGKQLLGSDFTTIVRDCKTGRKLDNAVKRHTCKLNNLKAIRPFLNAGYDVKILKISGTIL